MNIEAVEVYKRYGGATALSGVSLTVDPGECFGLLGPNGAGKSTLIRLVCGLANRDDGQLRTAGLDPGEHPREVRKLIGVVAQQDYLDKELTVGQNIYIYGRFHGLSRPVLRRRVADLLTLVGLEERHDDRVDTLSGGLRRRLAIARSLVNDPGILVLDEPSSGLDPAFRRGLWALIGDLQARNITILLSTHYLEEAERLCDRVAILDQGQVLAVGSPRDLIRRHSGEDTGVDGSSPCGETTTLEDVFLHLTARQPESAAAGEP